MEHIKRAFRYDVFLSFRGADTRYNFTSHLHGALKHKYDVFHDTSLPRGQGIEPELLEAIKESRIYVVVLSTRYADSKWCLKELSEMMQCVHMNDQHVVIPIFLGVEQSDIGTPNGSFAKLIKNQGSNVDQETVKKWREALQEVQKLDALHLQDNAKGDESELVEQIVEKIRKLLHDQTDHNVADPNHVGVESRVQEVKGLFGPGSEDDDDVRIVVIYGPEGIGKTTIAKATYERLAIDFKPRYSCFLSDVKTIFGEANGKLTLQKKLISNLGQTDESRIRLDNYHQGFGIIEKRITNQKLLLVLDDVDNEEQLKILGINREVLGRGSRIIVTTRDESSIVCRIKPDATYMPRLLDENESLKVFCLYAFGQDNPKEGYEDVSRKAAGWGTGRPRILKDVAVHMRHYQTVEEWGCALRYVIHNPSYITEGTCL